MLENDSEKAHKYRFWRLTCTRNPCFSIIHRNQGNLAYFARNVHVETCPLVWFTENKTILLCGQGTSLVAHRFWRWDTKCKLKHSGKKVRAFTRVMWGIKSEVLTLQTCVVFRALYSLNISRCVNVTHLRLATLIFDLVLLNIAHC